MFSVMTAVLSPRVMETLAPRRDTLFAALQERAGVLCVQPSSGVCLLQGEWEAMKRAHGVLEELCLQQVQAQTTMHAFLRARQRHAFPGNTPDDPHNNNYHKMAEEAIRNLAVQRNNLSPTDTRDDARNDSGSLDSNIDHKNQDSYYSSRRNSQMSPIPNGHDEEAQPQVNGAKTFNSPPRAERDTPMTIEQNGIDKSEENGSDNLPNERISDEKGSPSEPGSSSAGAEEGETAEAERLRMALDEEDRDDDEDLHEDDHYNEDEAENLSVRRKSQDTDGSSPCSPNSHPGNAELPMPRYDASYVAGIKPEPAQLRAMAQFYAMQQNVINYGYLAAETRKLIEARLTGQLPGHVPPFPLPHGLAAPPPDMKHPYNLSMNTPNNNHIKSEGSGGSPDDGDSMKENDDGERDREKYSKMNGDDKLHSTPKHGFMGGGGGEWPPPPGLKNYVGPYVVPSPAGPHGPKPYECPACLATFATRDSVQEHMLQAHAVGPGLSGNGPDHTDISPVPQPPQLSPSANTDAYTCPVCGKYYKSGQRLREHVLLHDKNYQRPQFPCPACGKTFTYRHNMKVHFQKIHKGKQPIKRHECHVCGQKFHKPVYLRHHLLRHKESLYAGHGTPFGGGDVMMPRTPTTSIMAGIHGSPLNSPTTSIMGGMHGSPLNSPTGPGMGGMHGSPLEPQPMMIAPVVSAPTS